MEQQQQLQDSSSVEANSALHCHDDTVEIQTKLLGDHINTGRPVTYGICVRMET